MNVNASKRIVTTGILVFDFELFIGGRCAPSAITVPLVKMNRAYAE